MNTKCFFIAILFVVAMACSEKELVPISKGLGKPGVVSNVKVSAISGGANISYTLPDQEDILGVKAVYELQNGQTREVFSSFYQTNLTVKGYNDIKPHSVKLYAFNRAQELSDPVEITFTPLKSALEKVIESFSFIADFGGVKFMWKNEDKESLDFEFLGENTNGKLSSIKIIASEVKDASDFLRGFDTTPHRFAAIVSDRWGNVSDTLFPVQKLITPLFEEQLDYKKIEILNNNQIPSTAALTYPFENDVRWDYTGWASGNSAYSMFDGNKNTWSHTYNGTVPGAAFTVDLHCVMKLSRLHTIQRDYNYTARVYNQGNIDDFEVWGALQKPVMDGKWAEAGWIKLGTYKTIKPSGTPLGTVTDEDLSVAANGHDFPFDIGLTSVRYIRLKVNHTFGSVSNCYFAEVSFFGKIEGE